MFGVLRTEWTILARARGTGRGEGRKVCSGRSLWRGLALNGKEALHSPRSASAVSGAGGMRDAEVNVELLKLLEVPGVGSLGAEVWGQLQSWRL